MKYGIEIVKIKNNQEYTMAEIECPTLEEAEKLYNSVTPKHIDTTQVGILLINDNEIELSNYSQDYPRTKDMEDL